MVLSLISIASVLIHQNSLEPMVLVARAWPRIPIWHIKSGCFLTDIKVCGDCMCFGPMRISAI